MDKSINVVIHELKQDLVKLVTRDNLPASIVSLVVNEVAMQVNNQTEKITQRELEELKKPKESDNA